MAATAPAAGAGTEARREAVRGLMVSPEALECFHEDVQYLWCCGMDGATGSIPIYAEPPTALEFLRNHVSVSRPCIIQNAILTENGRRPEDQEQKHQEEDPSTTTKTTTTTTTVQLTLDELLEQMPHLPLHVDVTPDGHGDCLRQTRVRGNQQKQQQQQQQHGEDDDDDDDPPIQTVFVKPHEVEMPLNVFAKHLRHGRAKQQKKQEFGQDKQSAPAAQIGAGCHEGQEDSSFASAHHRIFPLVASTKTKEEDEVVNGRTMDTTLDLDDCVLYYSRQNDCLRQELSTLWNHLTTPTQTKGTEHNNAKDSSVFRFQFPHSLPWAEQAFGVDAPDAVNLWMGDERAVLSLHKDHYENLFYVLSGEKLFGLCPPADAPFLSEQPVMSGRFCRRRQDQDKEEPEEQHAYEWVVQMDTKSKDENGTDEEPLLVHWIAANVFDDDNTTTDERNGDNSNSTNRNQQPPHPQFLQQQQQHAVVHPIHNIKVRAGELLYLPSLWFHKVTQSCETVAINFWYDMKFESPLWCYFHFLQQLQPTSSPAAAPSLLFSSSSLSHHHENEEEQEED